MSYGINVYKVTQNGLVSLLVTSLNGQGYTLTGEVTGNIHHEFAALEQFEPDETEMLSLVRLDAELVMTLQNLLTGSSDFSKSIRVKLADTLSKVFDWFFPVKGQNRKDFQGSVQGAI